MAYCSLLDDDENVSDPLLGDAASDVEERRGRDTRDDAITIPKALVTPNLLKPLLIVCFAMLCQQLSGVNAGTKHEFPRCPMAQVLTTLQSSTTATISCLRHYPIWARTCR